LTFGGSNTYAGGTVVDQGTLAVTNNYNLGAGTASVTLAGGALQLGGTAGLNLGNRPISLSTGGGTISVTNTSAAGATIGGLISGSGGLDKTGPGRLILSDSDTYEGGTAVDAGTLVLESKNALRAGSSLTIGNAGSLKSDFMLDGSPSAAAPLAASPAAVSVPEPGTVALLMVGFWSIAIYCRWTRF
jgi:autotransporter-associated beta strand protein